MSLSLDGSSPCPGRQWMTWRSPVTDWYIIKTETKITTNKRWQLFQLFSSLTKFPCPNASDNRCKFYITQQYGSTMLYFNLIGSDMFQGLLNMQNPVKESGKIVSLILWRHTCTKQLKDIVHRGYLQLIYSSTTMHRKSYNSYNTIILSFSKKLVNYIGVVSLPYQIRQHTISIVNNLT